jgi:uncharacterized repeat protein (TIGR01451 family)
MSATTTTDDREQVPEDDSEAEAEDTPEAVESAGLDFRERYDTDHWGVVGFAALLAAGLGVTLSQPALVLVAVVGVGLLAHRQATTTPGPELALERTFDEDDPEPGDVVEVETTITNVGDETLADCRFVDLVPGELSVVDGSPRRAAVLRPGESCTLTYSIRAQRGRHSFGGVYTIVSNLAGTTEHEYHLGGDREFVCIPSMEPLQATVLRQLTTPYAGRLTTDKPGEGLEFHATREYRRGDSLRRIDWNQYASTGELATLQFRTERSASVVLLADVRASSYVRADDDDPHAADRVVEAVGRLFVTLLDNDHRAGIATFGPDYWLSPNDGTEHRSRGLEALGTEPTLSPSPPDGQYPVRLRVRRLLRRLPEMTQVIICSPLLDDATKTAVQRLESAGHDVIVVSPDPTAMDTPGETVYALERKRRIRDIHQYGVPVVDWPLEDQLDVVIARTITGWSQ